MKWLIIVVLMLPVGVFGATNLIQNTTWAGSAGCCATGPGTFPTNWTLTGYTEIYSTQTGFVCSTTGWYYDCGWRPSIAGDSASIYQDVTGLAEGTYDIEIVAYSTSGTPPGATLTAEGTSVVIALSSLCVTYTATAIEVLDGNLRYQADVEAAAGLGSVYLSHPAVYVNAIYTPTPVPSTGPATGTLMMMGVGK